MDINEMLNLQNAGSTSQLSATGSVIGGIAGAAVGNPMLGSMAGSAIGTLVSNFIPQYSHIKGSVSGINFVKLQMRPYCLKLVTPDPVTASQISDYYCYFGCKTMRTEALNIGNYMYNNHAFVKGTIEYNGAIPADKFQQIQSIFKKGVHILNG